jgi:transposase
VAGPTFDCPDLTSFCLIYRLGLRVTDCAVLACRVAEPEDVIERSCWCARCGKLGAPRAILSGASLFPVSK